MVGRWAEGGRPTTYRPPFYGAACSQLPAHSIAITSMTATVCSFQGKKKKLKKKIEMHLSSGQVSLVFLLIVPLLTLLVLWASWTTERTSMFLACPEKMCSSRNYILNVYLYPLDD